MILIKQLEHIAHFLFRFRLVYFILLGGAVLNWISHDLRGYDDCTFFFLPVFWLLLTGMFVAQFHNIRKRLLVERLKVEEDQAVRKYLLSDTHMTLVAVFFVFIFTFLSLVTVALVVAS